MVTLREAKQYLKIDYCDDDSLIQTLLDTAIRYVKDIGRLDDCKAEIEEDVVKTATLSALGYLYENRSNPDYHKLQMSLRSLLFAQREGRF